MKTLIPILFAIILLFSCKKQVCYFCDIKTYGKYDDHFISVHSVVLCDKSELEILTYESDHYNFSDPASYTRCDCVKQ